MCKKIQGMLLVVLIPFFILIPLNKVSLGHWVKTHEFMTDLAIERLEKDSRAEGDKYKPILDVLKQYKSTLVQGIRDADLRANWLNYINFAKQL